IALIAHGMRLKSYNFDKYRTTEKLEDKPSLQDIIIHEDDFKDSEAAFTGLESISRGVFFARDLVTEPPNILYPESYANICKSKLTDLGVEVKILNEREMDQLGMGALLGVGQGSERESRLVIMKWNGHPNGPDEAPLAFVGKGVTFDTGGISIKPSKGMEDMKYDMAGSATVAGLMKTLASRKAKVNAVGVIGLAENMPGHNAQRPSDVVHSLSGQTIEVLNTDAEGRLVLADALWYTQDNYNPKIMINLATLTGAIVVSLSHLYGGLFSNNDKLSDQLLAAGDVVGERLWRMPLDKVGKGFDKFINSKIADVQNISTVRGGGSTTAGQFLQRFVNDVPWAHLDIAGMAWADKAQNIVPVGASGYGVRLLNQLVLDYYE
ncbi:MAG: leucyl aminopeptidase, partial [Pseudomonadota bacterium]